MAQAILVTDKEGKSKIILTHNIKSIDAVPAVPEEPAVEAADEVKDDPGEEPSATNPAGRPPVKGHPKIEAKEGKPGVPEGAVIHSDGGDVEVSLPVSHLLGLINN